MPGCPPSIGWPCGLLAPSPAVDALGAIAHDHPYRRGDVVAHEGEPAEFLGVVHSGRVKILKNSACGRELILRVLQPGQVFGLVPVLDGRPFPATVAMVDDGTIGRVAAADFHRLLRERPDIAMQLLRDVGERLRELGDALCIATTSGAESRLASKLLGLAPRGAVKATRQELAALAGTTVETAIRVTKSWERSGLVALARGRIAVLDREELARRVQAGA